MSTLKVDTILKRTGTGTITLGQSGDTIALGSGASQTLATNTPAFHVTLTSDQNHTQNSFAKIPFNNEVYDTDNAFEVKEDARKQDISRAFKKSQKNKSTSKRILNEFISVIA